MKRLRIAAVAFSVVAAGFVFNGCGATQYRTPARQRRRQYVIETDFYRLGNDIDWLLGIDRPTSLYDQTLR